MTASLFRPPRRRRGQSGAVCMPISALCDGTGGSPNTAIGYGYDLRYLFEFLTDRELDWRQFQPSVAFDLLGWLRQRPCRRRVQQLSLSPWTAGTGAGASHRC